MRKRAASSYLLGFAALAAACQQPATSSSSEPSKGADGSDRAAATAPACSAPAGWNIEVTADAPDHVVNIVSINAAGTTHWNGIPIDKVKLRQYMDVVSTMLPTPGTAVEVDPGAPCAQVADAVRIVGNAVECERYCSYATGPFDRPAPPPLAPPSPPRP
jgi:hypothetical protein